MTDEDFIKRAKKIGYNLTERQLDSFHRLYDILISSNTQFNLTAITEYSEVVIKHFLDSILLGKVWTELKRLDSEVMDLDFAKIIDVGTGAGFPGVPLKILYENSSIHLVDSLQKRINYLDMTVRELSLTNIEAIHARSEELGKDPQMREKFDISLSRAVAALPVLCEYCLPFVRMGGYFVAYKSKDVEDEENMAQNAIKILGGKHIATLKETIPDTEIERAFVIIKKISHTPEKYPRKAGVPAKKPL